MPNIVLDTTFKIECIGVKIVDGVDARLESLGPNCFTKTRQPLLRIRAHEDFDTASLLRDGTSVGDWRFVGGNLSTLAGGTGFTTQVDGSPIPNDPPGPGGIVQKEWEIQVEKGSGGFGDLDPGAYTVVLSGTDLTANSDLSTAADFEVNIDIPTFGTIDFYNTAVGAGVQTADEGAEYPTGQNRYGSGSAHDLFSFTIGVPSPGAGGDRLESFLLLAKAGSAISFTPTYNQATKAWDITGIPGDTKVISGTKAGTPRAYWGVTNESPSPVWADLGQGDGADASDLINASVVGAPNDLFVAKMYDATTELGIGPNDPYFVVAFEPYDFAALLGVTTESEIYLQLFLADDAGNVASTAIAPTA